MSGFVIEYNRRTRDHFVTEFLTPTGAREALLLRLDLEKKRPNRDWEIVSLISDSRETIQKTHSRYFEGRELSSSPF